MSPESQSHEPVECRSCGSSNSPFDLHCGACGQPLARLRWATLGGEWHSGDGRVAITQNSNQAIVRLRHDSSLPVALVLQDGWQDAPDWLALDSLRNRVVYLKPGAVDERLEIPLRLPELEALFRSETAEEARSRSEFKLRFLTSLRTTFDLSLLVARRPWIDPSATLYRFLPVERLRDPGIEHAVTIHNDAAESIEIEDVEIVDLPGPSPEGCVGLEGNTLLRPEKCRGQKISPGATWTHTVRVIADSADLVAEAPGWLAVVVSYRLRSAQETLTVEHQLQGLVGRGPTVRSLGAGESVIRDPYEARKVELPLENPGHLPVQITRVETRRRRREEWGAAPETDWLVVGGLRQGEILAPGEQRPLRLLVQPRARPVDEFNEEVVEREVVIEHDGWPDLPDARVVHKVVAHLGRVQIRNVGIDFGTSNSVVCMFSEKKSYPLPLEILEGRKLNLLASLLYFDGHKELSAEELALKGEDSRFVFGEEARGSAGLEPANLIRSFKAVVMKGEDEKYRFIRKGPEGQDTTYVRSPQQLLDLFIRELKERAEDNLVHLDSSAWRESGLREEQVAFRKAVFSHPVEVSEAMKEALMHAAHAAGINLQTNDPAEFFRDCCIDEATAAVLAYVDQQMDEPDSELPDLERVLCFDMGGGTTDVALVEIKDAAAYARGEADRVTVALRNKDGDSSFGGDHLDREVARWLVEQVQLQSQESGAPVMTDEVSYALEASSQSAFEAAYKKRASSGKGPQLGQDVREQVAAIWRLAGDLLREAERAKQKLSEADEVPVTISGSQWPRHGDDAAARAAAAENFTLSLSAETFEEIVRRGAGKRLEYLDSVVRNSGLDWPSITTVLLSGQSVRSPLIRNLVVEHVQRRRGDGAPEVKVVGPESGFDPKLCVAIGAAIWGESRTRGYEWLRIDRDWLNQLNFDLTLRAGRGKFKPVEGLERGKPFPARASFDFSAPRDQLTLYRDGKPYVVFDFAEAATKIEVEVHNLTDLRAIVGGHSRKGRITS